MHLRFKQKNSRTGYEKAEAENIILKDNNETQNKLWKIWIEKFENISEDTTKEKVKDSHTRANEKESNTRKEDDEILLIEENDDISGEQYLKEMKKK